MTHGKRHRYAVKTVWSGAAEGGTRDYRSYSREHRLEFEGKPPLRGSSDPAFRGDPSLYNPEELLVAALSACHMLWYLHLCAVGGIEVQAYEDRASGEMVEEPGASRFTSVTLRPLVTVRGGSDRALALALHEKAHAECYIANSVNFPVGHEAEIVESEG